MRPVSAPRRLTRRPTRRPTRQHAAVCSASEASISGLVERVVSIALTAFKAANALQAPTFSACADCRAGPRRARKVTNGCRTSGDESDAKGELGNSETEASTLDPLPTKNAAQDRRWSEA